MFINTDRHPNAQFLGMLRKIPSASLDPSDNIPYQVSPIIAHAQKL